jgi:hypothetical protein
VIAGSDIATIRGGPWRIGSDTDGTVNGSWCPDGNQMCYPPDPPAGTASAHTIIQGENCINGCPSVSGIGPDTTKLVELYGGFGLYKVIQQSSAHVTWKGFGVTRHSDCIQHGQPALPSVCNRNPPFSDYAVGGINTGPTTDDVLFQDMWVHGFPDRGVLGAIGGTVTAERVQISYNGMAGWDFDDGNQTPSANNPTWNFLDSIIEFSGCNQEYPYTHAIPVSSCYSQSTGGYGDGVGTPPGTALNINVKNSISRYNTQDGMDPGHVDTGASTLSVTNSQFYGNGGQQFKWGYNFTSATFTNNLVVGNCNRMSAPLAGAPSTYNANLSDFCRAGSTISWNLRDGQTGNLSNNTIFSYGPVAFVLGCSTVGGCPHSTTTIQGNIILGYDNQSIYNNGGQAGGPGFLYCQDNTTNGTGVNCAQMGIINRSNNTLFGLRSATLAPTEIGSDPRFVGEAPPFINTSPLALTLAQATANEQSLDVYSATFPVLSAGSPSAGQGATSTSTVQPPPPPPPAVIPTTPTITWGNPASIVYGTALSSTQLNAKASILGSFTYSPAAGTVPAVGTDTLSVTFVPTDTTDFTNATASVQIVVTAPVVIPPPPPPVPTPKAFTFTITHSETITCTPTLSGNAYKWTCK